MLVHVQSSNSGERDIWSHDEGKSQSLADRCMREDYETHGQCLLWSLLLTQLE